MMSLQKKLSIALFFLLVALGAFTWLLAQNTANRYSQEFYQRLNMPITMYMVGQRDFFPNGKADHQTLIELADLVMVVNPSLEIYLLDSVGRIVSHPFSTNALQLNSVSLEPINNFLSRSEHNLLLGDDPKSRAEKNIFSVHPIEADGRIQGYLYAVLAGQNFQTLLADVRHSHTLVNAATILGLSLFVALISGIAAFYFLTRRLRALTHAVENIDVEQQTLLESISLPQKNRSDEIDCLIKAFETLLNKNAKQYQLLQQADQNRRELIANISHDLRTPLTSMQGYLETLIIKDKSLTEVQKVKFVDIAFKQSQRLGYLVADLFELAKLDYGRVTLKVEPFSLLELIYDVIQDFELKAQQKGIRLQIKTNLSDAIVKADIQLIQRVFENLLSNAMRFTPNDGDVVIFIDERLEQIVVRVENDGEEISVDERQYIFQRYYRAHNPKENPEESNQHSGIGLAIVDKILALHQCSIKLCSHHQQGTAFEFNLPVV
jgi:signal transduction histidine kinase